MDRTDVLRLVDQEVLPLAASTGGQGERYGRGESSHTVHVWWARRPHSAMRALVFASLVPVDAPHAGPVLEALGGSTTAEPDVVARAQRLVAPGSAVLDMFGGGGTVALEAAALGVDATSVDVNPLAVFSQRCLAAATRGGPAMAERVQQVGHQVLQRLEALTAPLFPRRADTLAYLWTYGCGCPGCDYRLLLSRRPWLARKPGKNWALRLQAGPAGDRVELDRAVSGALPSRWQGRGVLRCPRCGQGLGPVDIRTCPDRLLARVAGTGNGKDYALAGDGDVPGDSALAQAEQEALGVLGVPLPGSVLPRWSGIVNPPLHGMATHADMFNRRQRAVLLRLLQALAEAHGELAAKEPERAGAVVGLLTGLVDQLVDWNCRLSTWLSQNEQVGRAFSGPGIPMVWDFVETDPLQHGPANLHAKLQRLVHGIRYLDGRPGRVTVLHAAAQHLPLADASFDAVVTDPPYYDNLYYSVLADCFYAWKRMLGTRLDPSLFGAADSGSPRELVASAQRHGSAVQAHAEYCRELTDALREAARVLKPGAPLVLVYGHRAVRGWAALVHAFQRSGLTISTVHPLAVERRQRPRAMNADAANTCVVLVARRDGRARQALGGTDVAAQADQWVCSQWAQALRKEGWEVPDLALTVFARGVAALGGGAPQEHGEIQRGLEAVAAAVARAFPGFALSGRSSL